MKDLPEYISKATKNVEEDRAATKTLLMSLMRWMTVSDERHKEAGIIAAKYLETLQRSNEQLVKISSLIQKQQSGESSITSVDKEQLFDLIQGDE